MEQPVKQLYVLYEPGHADELDRHWKQDFAKKDNSLVIALGLDIEAKLTERGISFVSGRAYKQTFPDQLDREDALLEAFFADPHWKNFTYRGVLLITTFQFMFRAYFQRVWYYSNLLISIIEAHPDAGRLVLFAPGGGFIASVAGALAEREIRTVADCAEAIASARGVEAVIVPLAASQNAVPSSVFMLKRSLFGLFLRVWNAVVKFAFRPRRPRLLVSDYWKHVGPCIEQLPEAECIFLDRTEIRHIPWRTLLTHRMQFIHIDNFLSRDMCRSAHESAKTFNRVWSELRSTVAPVFLWRGYSFDSLFLRAIDTIVSSFEKTFCEIEGAYALYESLRPDAVLLRTSVSGQTHFSILPLVAQRMTIPSLELQHGLEYLGPGSWSREHAAEYIAAYGPLVKKELVALGHAPEKVREIGSPRFDAYHKQVTVKKPAQFVVLCIAPDIRAFDIYDSYSAEDYFAAVARAVKNIPSAHMIIKLRSGPAGENLLRGMVQKTFASVPHSIAQQESLEDVLAQSDAVISCFSTAILEALQVGLPVIIPALHPIDQLVVDFHFSSYRGAHALYIPHTQTELDETLYILAVSPDERHRVQKAAHTFLAQNFSFDGRSSERCAALIGELTRSGRIQA